MNDCIRGIALLFILTMAFFARGDDAAGTAGLEAALAKVLPADGMGASVLVARDGKILFNHAYGWADRENKIVATPDTQFRIGSDTKQFTAAAILHLAELNKLSLDDPLSKYFPGYPGGDTIVLRHLLTHTSGLHNYTEHPDFMARVIHPIAGADLVAWFRNDPPDFAPGAEFRYSNTNYVLLGQIVEKVSGQAYGDFLQQIFFDPIGMHDTGVWDNAHPPSNGAKGYSYQQGQFQPAIDWDMSWAGGAGNLYSTTADLWRWTEALQGGRVLSAASLALMQTEVTVPKKETEIGYGMGLYRSKLGWLPVVGHNGGLQGYSSVVMWFPEQKATLVVLTNAMPSPPGKSPTAILSVAARAALSDEMAASAPKVDPSISPATYPDYVGRYDYKSGIQEVTTENGHLYAQLTGQNKFEIFPSGRDSFFFKVTEAGMDFDRNASGAVYAVTHTQNGMTFTALKLSDTDMPRIPIAALDQIVGQYQYGLLAVLTVTRSGDQLYAQLTGQPKFPIFAKSDHEFYWRVVPARVEFVRGPDGKITGAIHHQNGITFNAPRLSAK